MEAGTKDPAARRRARLPPYPRPGSTDWAWAGSPPTVARVLRGSRERIQTRADTPHTLGGVPDSRNGDSALLPEGLDPFYGPSQPKLPIPPAHCFLYSALRGDQPALLTADATGQPRQRRALGSSSTESSGCGDLRTCALGTRTAPRFHPKTPAAAPSVSSESDCTLLLLPRCVSGIARRCLSISWKKLEKLIWIFNREQESGRGIGPTESASEAARRTTERGGDERTAPRVREAEAHREFAETRSLARSLAGTTAGTEAAKLYSSPRQPTSALPGDTAAAAAASRRLPLARHRQTAFAAVFAAANALPDASGWR